MVRIDGGGTSQPVLDGGAQRAASRQEFHRAKAARKAAEKTSRARVDADRVLRSYDEKVQRHQTAWVQEHGHEYHSQEELQAAWEAAWKVDGADAIREANEAIAAYDGAVQEELRLAADASGGMEARKNEIIDRDDSGDWVDQCLDGQVQSDFSVVALETPAERAAQSRVTAALARQHSAIARLHSAETALGNARGMEAATRRGLQQELAAAQAEYEASTEAAEAAIDQAVTLSAATTAAEKADAKVETARRDHIARSQQEQAAAQLAAVESGDYGSVIVDSAVSEAAINDVITKHPELLSAENIDLYEHLTTDTYVGLLTGTPSGHVPAEPNPEVYQPDTAVNDTRQQQIDDWVADSSDASGGWLVFGGTSSAEHVYDALQGNSELGTLSANEQRYLVDKMLDKWGHTSDVAELARLVANGDSGTKSIVSERLAIKSAEILRNDAGKDDAGAQSQAHRLAVSAIEASDGDSTALGAALQSMMPEDGGLFVQALADPNGATSDPEGYNGRLAVLNALNEGPASQTTSAMVQNIFATSTASDVGTYPSAEYAHAISVALAREWFPGSAPASVATRNAATARLEGILTDQIGDQGYNAGSQLLFAGPLDKRVTALAVIRMQPEITSATLNSQGGDPALNPAIVYGMAEQLTPQGTPNRALVVKRMAGILGTEQGQTLLFGATDGDDNTSPQMHVLALQIVLSTPSITADTLSKTRDPWQNEAISEPVAQAQATQFRNDEPVTYYGTGLENMVGVSMGFQPTLPADMGEQEIFADAAAGELSLFSGEDGEAVQTVADTIRMLGGENPQVTVLPVTYLNGEVGAIQLPLYRVQTVDGEKYVDNLGRSYDTFEEWKKGNELPPGQMVFPENGHITSDGQNGIKLTTANTPKTVDTAGEVARTIIDYAALVGGVVAGVALIIGSGGTATMVVVGVAASGWGAYRAGSEIVDRHTHDQSIDPVTNSEARSLWLDLAANATGVGAFASEAALMRFLSTETRLGRTAAMTIGTGRVSATVTDGVAFVNAGADLYENWGMMTSEERAMALLQMSFWGVTSAVGARQARNFNELLNPAAAGRALFDGYNPPVERTADLPGNAVQMVRNPSTGEWTIRAGLQATDADIALHVKMVRLTMKDRGLEGLIRGMLGEPAPGTTAYYVKMESIKLHERVQQLEAKLADPNLTPQERTQLEGDIAATQGHLNQVLQMSERVLADPNIIAANSLGRQQAERSPGLVDALENGQYGGQGYYFRINEADPNGAPLIVRINGYDTDHPPLIAIRREEGWGVEVSSQPLPQSREEWRLMIGHDYENPNPNMPRTEAALTASGASKFVRGYVRSHYEVFIYLESQRVDVAAIVSRVARQTDSSAEVELRHELRSAMANYINDAPTGEGRISRLNEAMTVQRTNGERGALFTAFRQSNMPSGFVVVDPQINATSIDGTTRRADGLIEMPGRARMPNGYDATGTFLAEDKSGANAYDPAQAQRYSDALENGHITAKNGDMYEGVLYFFQNERAAEAAVNNMKVNDLSDHIHVGFYEADGTFKWIR